MSLEEQVCLDVRVIIPRVGKLEGDTGGELPQKGVLLVSDGEVFILSSRGEDFNEALQFCLVVE